MSGGRRFPCLVAVVAATAWLSTSCAAGGGGRNGFVLVGNVTHTSAVVAVGIQADAADAPHVTVNVFHAADDSSDAAVGAVVPLAAEPALDDARFQPYAVVKLLVTELQPNTQYVFTVSDGQRGGFHTLPLPEQPAAFSFAMASCAFTGSNSPVFTSIASSQPLLFLHTGDLFYGDIDTPDVPLYADHYWRTLTAPTQRQLYAAMPLVYMWDDHDFGPNNSDGSMPCGPAAAAAYRRTVPHYPLPADALDAELEHARRGTYHAFTVATARFIVTDLRSQRVPRFETDGPDKTCLGVEQRQWLLDEFRSAAASHDVIFWVSTMPWHTAHKKWGWYKTEAATIIAFLRQHDIAHKVIVLSGDAHMLAVDDGSNSPGGLPVLHAAALDHKPSTKGGPYSHGSFPGTGQWATVSVAPDTRDVAAPSVCVTFTGRRTAPDDAAAVTDVVTWSRCMADPTPAPAAAKPPRRGRSAWLRNLLPECVTQPLRNALNASPLYVGFRETLRRAPNSWRFAVLCAAALGLLLVVALARAAGQWLCVRLCARRMQHSKQD